MAEREVASTIDMMIVAGDRLRDTSESSSTLSFGRFSIDYRAPQHLSRTGISLLDGFFREKHHRESVFRLSVIDDRFVGSQPQVSWPTEWYQPFGVLQERYTQPYRLALDVHSSSLSLYDPEERHAVVWFHDLDTIKYWYAATPFRLQLSWFADSFDGEMIHAAGVQVDQSILLLVGPSGAGKSTLAAGAIQLGARIIGDDFVLLDGLTARAVYRRTKFHDTSLAMLNPDRSPIGQVLNRNNLGEKRIVETLDDHLTTQDLPISGIVIPVISGSVALKEVSPHTALTSLVGPTMMGLLGGSRLTLQRLTRLVRTVPAFRLHVGPDISENAEALFELASTLQTRSMDGRPT